METDLAKRSRSLRNSITDRLRDLRAIASLSWVSLSRLSASCQKTQSNPESEFLVVHTPDRPRHLLSTEIPSEEDCAADIVAWHRGIEARRQRTASLQRVHSPMVGTSGHGQSRTLRQPRLRRCSQRIGDSRCSSHSENFFSDNQLGPEDEDEYDDASITSLGDPDQDGQHEQRSPEIFSPINSRGNGTATSTASIEANYSSVEYELPGKSGCETGGVDPAENGRREMLIRREIYKRGVCPHCRRSYSDPDKCNSCGHAFAGYNKTTSEDPTFHDTTFRVRGGTPCPASLNWSQRTPETMEKKAQRAIGTSKEERSERQKSEEELSEDEIHINSLLETGDYVHEPWWPRHVANMMDEFPCWASRQEASPRGHVSSKEVVRLSKNSARRQVRMSKEPAPLGERANVGYIRPSRSHPSLAMSKMNPDYEQWERWRALEQQAEARRLVRENGDDAVLFEEIYACYEDSSKETSPDTPKKMAGLGFI
ncbi:hypothetical protein GQ53DRAFT_294413 [Thozetella sp. PMI_491]|nr:hypothetical protein GQ53DRAFT_294413 [Thozetella sp. PMI_491]